MNSVVRDYARRIGLSAATILLTACTSLDEGNSSAVTLYYDTTRKPAEGHPIPDKYFSNEADERQNRPPHFGIAVVAIPARRPATEQGIRITSFSKAFTVSGDFLNEIRARFRNDRKPVIVYVHGFNNGFAVAAHRAAFFAQQLQPDVSPIPVIYSWPSAASLFRYAHDEESSMLDQDRLHDFLTAVGANVPPASDHAANVLYVGHSLGCRALTLALRDLYLFRRDTGKLKNGPMFEHLVLLEPDVGNEYFAQHLGELRWLFKDITVYISPRDVVLHASGIIHGFNRVGQDTFADLQATNHRSVPLARVDLINASALRSDLVGHSYDDPEFFADLHLLIQKKSAAERVGHTLASPDPSTGVYTLVK